MCSKLSSLLYRPKSYPQTCPVAHRVTAAVCGSVDLVILGTLPGDRLDVAEQVKLRELVDVLVKRLA